MDLFGPQIAGFQWIAKKRKRWWAYQVCLAKSSEQEDRKPGFSSYFAALIYCVNLENFFALSALDSPVIKKSWN